MFFNNTSDEFSESGNEIQAAFIYTKTVIKITQLWKIVRLVKCSKRSNPSFTISKSSLSSSLSWTESYLLPNTLPIILFKEAAWSSLEALGRGKGIRLLLVGDGNRIPREVINGNRIPIDFYRLESNSHPFD